MTTEDKELGQIDFRLSKELESRLDDKCFRKFPPERSGNFAEWDDARAVLSDKAIYGPFIRIVTSGCDSKLFATTVCIETDFALGWPLTDDIKNYSPDQLEVFKPNRKSTALRVKQPLLNLLIPSTKFVTVKYYIRTLLKGKSLVIEELFPGKYIGALTGDISAREQCVFFYPDHPCAPIE